MHLYLGGHWSTFFHASVDIMKYLLFVITMLFSAYVAAEMSLTQKMLKPVIEYQCVAELKDSKIWTASTYFMLDANKSKLQSEVCGCIGEHALENVPAKTLLHATVSEDAKNQLVKQAMLNSLKGCMFEKTK